MNDSEIIRFSSALMQFGVACYALRLGRIFNTNRIGWLVFSTLSLLAVLYFLAPTSLLNGFIPLGNKLDIVYGLVSIVLILGMIYLDVSSRERRRAEKAGRETHSEWEVQLEAKWAALTKANENWREKVTKLGTELAEQKQAREQAEKAQQEVTTTARQTEEALLQTVAQLKAEAASNQTESGQKAALEQAEQVFQSKLRAIQEQLDAAQSQLAASQEQLTAFQGQLTASQNQFTNSQNQFTASQEQLTTLRAVEADLRGTVAGLQASLAEQKQAQEAAEQAHQERLAASRQTGATEAAASVLPRMDNVLSSLDSVSLAANDLAEASIAQVSRIEKLMREKSRIKRVPVKRNPLDRQLRESLANLARRISDEKLQITRKIGLVKKTVGELRGSVPGADSTPDVTMPETTEEISVVAEAATETATTTDQVEEPSPVQADDSTVLETEAPASVEVADATPIQMDEPVQFDGGITLENYHEMTVSTVDLGDHLISNLTHTGTESAQTDGLAESQEESSDTLDQAEVRSKT
jgi:hypothetical protein